MPTFLLRFTVIMFTLSFAAVAQAQVADWYVAPSIVYTHDDADRRIDDSLAGGQIVVGRNILDYLSVEGLLGYSSIKGSKVNPSEIIPDQKHFDLSVNLLAYYNRDRAFAPYVMVGVGYLGVDADEGPPVLKQSTNDSNPSASVGLGFKWRMGQSKFSIRGEHRFRTVFDWDNLTDQLTTIGVQYDFGGFNDGIGAVESNPRTGGASDWYVAPSIVYTHDDADRRIDDSLAGGQIVVGRNILEYLSVEGLLGYSSIKGSKVNPSEIIPDQKHFDLSVNLLAYYNRDRAFAPYVMVGVGYLGVDADEGPPVLKQSTNDSNPSASVGLGFKWRMGQSKFSIRGEHRFRTVFDWDNLTDQLTTIGVQYDFGGFKQDISPPEANKDTDGDGVLDMWDECPNTRAGVEVTSRGCELKNIESDNDSDGDKVFDNIDECPNTPPGVPVNVRGCSLDGDMDGVTSDNDLCPASRVGAEVDEFGCEYREDADNDGVLDSQDRCPNTRAGARADVNGCEIKNVINLPGVNFQTNQDTILPGTESLLQSVADTLKKHADLQFEVAGHSDDVGDPNQNIGLSMRRAKTVRDYLISYGVNANRLTFKGYGEAQPIADNSTADGRAMNRRVELRLVTR